MVAFYINGQIGAHHASQAKLTLDRASRIVGWNFALDVFVNGIKVGSVSSGESEVFYFTPRADGGNTIFARLMENMAPTVDTQTLNFKALPGDSIYARYEISGSLRTSLLGVRSADDTKFEVATEQRQHIEAAVMSTKSRSPSSVPWDEVSGLSGVASVLLALLSLLKR